MIDVSQCKKSAKTKRTDKHIECEACGLFFLYNKKGRKPKTCEWYKKQQTKKQAELKKNKQAAKQDKNMMAIHDLIPIASTEEIKEGDFVYHVSNIFNNEDTNKRFATEYKVVDISGDNVKIRRSQTFGYVSYPIEVNFKELHKSVGVTYIRKDQNESE